MREWPPPQKSWVMAQTWRDLLFAHWPVMEAELRRVVPPQFELDLFEGQGWIGVIPFRMDGIHPRFTFPLPWISATPEINVRTYVTCGGKRGVCFFSLDASNVLAVKIARRVFHLPYFQATMNVRSKGETVRYQTKRSGAEFRGSYAPSSNVEFARPGTLEYWLTERYCFYALDSKDNVVRGDIDHAPWPLQRAEARIEANSMAASAGITLPDAAPMVHFSRKIDVVVWMPQCV